MVALLVLVVVAVLPELRRGDGLCPLVALEEGEAPLGAVVLASTYSAVGVCSGVCMQSGV